MNNIQTQIVKLSSAINIVMGDIVKICGDRQTKVEIHKPDPTDYISVRVSWRYKGTVFVRQKGISASVLLEHRTNIANPIDIFVEQLLKELQYDIGRLEYEY